MRIEPLTGETPDEYDYDAAAFSLTRGGVAFVRCRSCGAYGKMLPREYFKNKVGRVMCGDCQDATRAD